MQEREPVKQLLDELKNELVVEVRRHLHGTTNSKG